MDETEYNVDMQLYDELQDVKMDKGLAITPIVLFSLGIVALILGIVFIYAFNDEPFPYYALNVRAGSTNVMINEIFNKSGTWQVPKVINQDFQSFVYMTGGGGGGCTSSAGLAGGGGNSGVGVVAFPLLIHKKDVCSFVIGAGGQTNVDGGDTIFQCTSSTTGLVTVSITVQGGRSGCTPLGTPLGSTLTYPYSPEAFGARPLNATLAQSVIYGGIGGAGASGGAGSIFGNGAGGNSLSASSYGAGGSGAVVGNSNAGQGGPGVVKILWPMKIKDNV